MDAYTFVKMEKTFKEKVRRLGSSKGIIIPTSLFKHEDVVIKEGDVIEDTVNKYNQAEISKI